MRRRPACTPIPSRRAVLLPRRQCLRSCPDHQAGVGLIEVMVAVLILSIGFLGIGALMAMSLSTNNSSMARSMATVDSYSILDSMRADIANAKAKIYNTTVIANACPKDTDTLAKAQLKQWCTQLGDHLGKTASTTGKVACQADGNCVVTITFDDSRSGADLGGGTEQTIVTRALL